MAEVPVATTAPPLVAPGAGIGSGRTPRFDIKLVVIALALMMLTFVAFAFFTFNQQAQMISYRNALLDSYRRVGDLDRVFGLLQEAETGQRGFLLSHEERYLEHFEKATQDLKPLLERLAQSGWASENDRAQLKRIADLSRIKVSELQQTIMLERSGNMPSAHAVFKSGIGQATMEELRTIVSRLKRSENIKCDFLEQNLRRFTAMSTQAIIIVLCVAVVSLIGFGAVVVRLFAANLKSSQKSLADALEIERTRDQLSTVLTSMDEGLLLLDTASSVTFANQPAEKLFGASQTQLLGKTFLELFSGSGKRELSEYLSLDSVFKNKNSMRHLELELVRPNQKQLSVNATVSPLLQGEQATGAVVTFFDTTAQLESEKRLRAQFEITKILAKQLSIETAARQILELICEEFGWVAGSAYLLDDENAYLRAIAFSSTTSNTDKFSSACSTVNVFRGLCLAGRVWESEQPIWVENVLESENFVSKAEAAAAGIHTAVGLPFFSGQKLFGVILFYANEIKEHDPSRLAMLSSICSQIGQYMEINNARQLLIANERKFRAIFDKQFELIGLLDVDGRIVDANLAALTMGDTTFAAIVGQYFWDGPWWSHSEEARARAKASVIKAASGEFDRFQTEHLKGDETVYIDFSMQPLLDDTGEVIMLIPEGRDITPLKAAQEKLAESETMFRRLTETVKAIFWISSLEGKLLYLSPAFASITGGTVEAALADSNLFFKNVHPDDIDTAKALLMDVNGAEVQFRIVRADDDQAWISARSFPIQDTSGQTIQICGVAEDISDRKEAEKRVSEFYSTVSHELRSPLTSIRGSLGLIEGGLVGDVSEEAASFIKIARVESDRLIRIINSILDLRKIEAGKLELSLQATVPANLIDSAIENLHGMAQEMSVTLKKGTSSLEPIEVDRDRITQVLTNLISNSIKFSRKDSVVVVNSERLNDSVRFSVADQGEGISAKDLPKLFGKFQQLDSSDARSQGGTGLGLAICKALVEQHGGTIGVDSVVGQGSTFWFQFPVSRQPS